jgi:hypothetical protein
MVRKGLLKAVDWVNMGRGMRWFISEAGILREYPLVKLFLEANPSFEMLVVGEKMIANVLRVYYSST